jgi:hypothetical protein
MMVKLKKIRYSKSLSMYPSWSDIWQEYWVSQALPQYHVIATCVRITRYNLELQPMPTLTQAFRNLSV